MVALLGWTDGFGNDTEVIGIYSRLQEAAQHANLEGPYPDRYIEFNFGSVDFDYYEANKFKASHKYNHKRKEKI